MIFFQMSALSLWVKPVLPSGAAAVAFMYVLEIGGPIKVAMTFADLGLTHRAGYDVTEQFDGTSLGSYMPNDNFTCYVNPTGVYLIKATPKKTDDRLLYENRKEMLRRLNALP